jgi:hypothetical protein
MRKGKIAAAIAGAILVGLGASACSSDADVASKNVSKAADNFEVNRRIVVINGITDKYLMVITGACSIDTSDPGKLVAICKTSPGKYKKFFAGLSDNVTYTVEQGQPIKASAYHYRVIFKPETILPDVDFR